MSSTASFAESYVEIARRALLAEECALIVIDIQEKLLPPIFQKEQLLPNSQLLIRWAGVLKIPTIATIQYANGLGNTVEEARSLLPETGIDKQAFSCFGSDVFCSILKRLPGRRNTVLLCVEWRATSAAQTALSALVGEGYLVHVAADAISLLTDMKLEDRAAKECGTPAR